MTIILKLEELFRCVILLALLSVGYCYHTFLTRYSPSRTTSISSSLSPFVRPIPQLRWPSRRALHYSSSSSGSSSAQTQTLPRQYKEKDNPWRGDARKLREGSIIEYLSPKGSKRLALVNKRAGAHLDVSNEQQKNFSVPINRVTYLIEGVFQFEDLVNLNSLLSDMKAAQAERVWEEVYGKTMSYRLSSPSPSPSPSSSSSSLSLSSSSSNNRIDANNPLGSLLGSNASPPIGSLNISYISERIYGSSNPMNVFVTSRLMSQFGTVFFSKHINHAASSSSPSSSSSSFSSSSSSSSSSPYIDDILYYPLPPNEVQENLRDRAALREFKQRYIKAVTAAKIPPQSRPVAGGGNAFPPPPSSSSSTASASTTSTASASASNATAVTLLIPDMPDRMMHVLESYSEGLKQLVARSHPWVMNGWARRVIDEEAAAKGKELLEFLDLAPTVKNAKKVLEMIGQWPAHANIEKYVMDLRDKFPTEVYDEAQYLLDNSDLIPDPDERLRRDLRYLGTYAIDGEGASEIDDALSVEILEDGREKLWMHIADVSRWIRPGSALSLEAERRMVTVYMPDERISMFPDVLSSDLLSLGAGIDSYALSCGVTLDENGEVTSFEVCPSKIRVTRRLTYVQLEEILMRSGSSGVNENRIKTDSPSTPSSSLSSFPSSPSSYLKSIDAVVAADLSRLNYWAELRHKSRIRSGALDEYLRHKTELSLSVKRDPKSPKLQTVVGYMTWSNATSMSLVSEYMILMCETIGKMCLNINAPVWFKTQVPDPPLSPSDLELQEGETPFLRSNRIMRHLKPANDSKIPGPHCTSGAEAYVQCTSPIRRYHDLYNHYRLKAAMHGASLAEEWVDRAKEEAGISKLDNMATAQQRLETLNAVRLVTRQREQYWLQVYIGRLVNTFPRPIFDCLVADNHPQIELEEQEGGGGGGGGLREEVVENSPTSLTFYDVHAPQLGSFQRYKLYSPTPLKKGDQIRCHLYKRYTNPISYLLLPMDLDINDLPGELAAMLTSNTSKKKTSSAENSNNESTLSNDDE